MSRIIILFLFYTFFNRGQQLLGIYLGLVVRRATSTRAQLLDLLSPTYGAQRQPLRLALSRLESPLKERTRRAPISRRDESDHERVLCPQISSTSCSWVALNRSIYSFPIESLTRLDCKVLQQPRAWTTSESTGGPLIQCFLPSSQPQLVVTNRQRELRRPYFDLSQSTRVEAVTPQCQLTACPLVGLPLGSGVLHPAKFI